jgi:DNA-binding NarL/FixJ family response regulator
MTASPSALAADLRIDSGKAFSESLNMLGIKENLRSVDRNEASTQIKSEPKVAKIPIIVLTSSSADAELQRAYGLHANRFISKLVDFTEFIDAVRSIGSFGLKVVRLPRR